MMESSYCYQCFKRFKEEYLTDAKFEEHFYDWWERRWEKICGVMTDLEKKGANLSKIYDKLVPVDWTLWDFSQYDFFERTRVNIVNYDKKINSLKARLEYKDKIQKLEKETLKINSEFTEVIKKDMRRLYERKKANVEAEINAQEKDLKEFSEWLQKESEEAGVTPYRSKGVESMKIFTNLIGDLGDLLNPHFRGYFKDARAGLIKECGEAIAKLLNGYFINLDVNFNGQQVCMRYQRKKEKKKNND